MSAQRYPLFAPLCVSMGLPRPVEEYKFHPTRRWEFDFAWPEYRLALEVDGGLYMGYHGKKSRHSGGTGQLKDMEKFNAAAVLGWRVLKFTPQQLMTSTTILTIRQCFQPQQ